MYMAKKQKSIKKQAKTNKVKFGLRKLDFKKNWKKLSYLGLAGFLALTSVGYGLWNSVGDSSKAASVVIATNQNWTGPVTWNACKFYTQYGWKVKSWTVNYSSSTYNNVAYIWSTVGNVYFPTASPYSRSTITKISSGATYSTRIFIGNKEIPIC
jgi:hypothetical protein